MKSEPDVFGIDHLKKQLTASWDGVRNYQVRNMLRDQFKPGDKAFFYHSSTRCPAIVGEMTIESAGYPDPSAFDPQSPYFDGKSVCSNPRWFQVDVKYQRHFSRAVSLTELKHDPYLIESDFTLIRKGNRLSIVSVSGKQWRHILQLEKSASIL